jgi:hypothetical protein
VQREVRGPDDVLRAQIDEARLILTGGNWQEARQRLTALAREHPAQAAVYAALGDCYGAAGRWREAVSYYRQGLDREYDPDVAGRLAQARQQLAATAESHAVTKRTVVAVAASFAILLAVIATVILVSRHSHQTANGGRTRVFVPPSEPVQRPGAQAGTAMPTPAATPGAPALPAPPRTEGPAVAAPAVQPTPAPSPAAPGAVPPVIVTKRVEAPSTDQDFFLTQILASLSWPDGTSLSGTSLVQSDPYNGFAFVTLSMPRAVQGDLTDVVLRTAYNAAATLIKSDSGMQSLEVRVLEAVSSGAERPRTLVAYRGTTTRDAVEFWTRSGRQPGSHEIWYQVFAESWWNPEAPTSLGKQTK